MNEKMDIPELHDSVNHPKHYVKNGRECIDWIEEALTPEEFKGYLKGCALKYQWRFEEKGAPDQDLRKAEWYIDKIRSLYPASDNVRITAVGDKLVTVSGDVSNRLVYASLYDLDTDFTLPSVETQNDFVYTPVYDHETDF